MVLGIKPEKPRHHARVFSFVINNLPVTPMFAIIYGYITAKPLIPKAKLLTSNPGGTPPYIYTEAQKTIRPGSPDKLDEPNRTA